MSQITTTGQHTRAGRRALTAAIGETLVTIIALTCFAIGMRPIVMLPGAPDLTQLPDTPEMASARSWLTAAAVLLTTGFIGAVTAVVMGWRARDEDELGTWAWITAAAWPLLVIVMLGGLSAR